MQWEHMAISNFLVEDFCDVIWMLSETFLIAPFYHDGLARLLFFKF